VIKWVTIQLINAIAQNEEKLKIPMKVNILHLIATGNSPNMEKETMTPTKMDKADEFILKDSPDSSLDYGGHRERLQ
jgi:hypothetical protein